MISAHAHANVLVACKAGSVPVVSPRFRMFSVEQRFVSLTAHEGSLHKISKLKSQCYSDYTKIRSNATRHGAIYTIGFCTPVAF